MKKIISLMLCAGIFFTAAPVYADQTVDLDGYSFEIPDGWQSFGQIYYNGTDSFPRLLVADLDGSFDYFLSMGDDFASEYIADIDAPEVIIPLHEITYSDNNALTISVYGEVQGNSGGPAVVQTDIFENPAGGCVIFSYYYNDTNREYFSILDSVSFGGSSAAEAPAEEAGEPTMGQKNALGSAKNYLSVLPFSYTGLIHQLTSFDGYSEEDATYAADNCGADWDEQAVKCAKNYLDLMSFSRDGLIQQITSFDGFTQEQAEHAADELGY